MSNLEKNTSNQATRHYVRVMAFVVLGILVAFLIAYLIPHREIAEAPEVHERSEVVSEEHAVRFERSAPVRLQIHDLKLDATFVEPLGLNPDQSVSVPDSYEEVGWYKHGATPGEVGPAVILGHVDSYQGPAVFYSLGQLQIGDDISVTRADGTIAEFVVTEMERKLQTDFPTEKVYGSIDYPGLRLVTCSGVYNHGILRYSHNLIVYARLK